MLNTLVSIPGYPISEELYNGSRTLVYRGYRDTDSLPVVIKLLKNPYPSFSELVQFRNQYTIAKNLNSPLIIATYSLETYQNGYALVMEDFGGISLKDYFTRVETRYIVSLQEFLEIAIALCNTLDILYRERIIHKDIKPANILINPETKQVKLIDFSIASLLPRETQTLINPNVLEGTLAYISPEQTGRMNRGIDYRTDFYSLGVTFYELLTGELPFQSNDPMELVHCHIAKQPPSVIRDEIPQVISDIVMKLMAKNAEDRYQSVLGLKFDLEKCLHQLQVDGKLDNFEIAQRDVCDRFIIPDKLYGREAEVETLLQTFERVSLGATEMMLVAGFSGIGKTAIVNEVHKPIVRQRGYFIKGKYDQFQRNIPFSAFVQAFQDLMGQLLTESDVQIQQWKNKILSAVGENGQVIIEVIPELSKIIGEQAPAIELSGTAAQNRFNLLFQKFTQVFTSAEHPLVMFLDDLQWADSASLKLIQLLMADTNYLLLIGAYRDNEVEPGHPLILTLSEIQKNQATINTITLAPLSQVKVNQLVADTLKCPENLALTLSQLVFQKTQGNPFFATQFLKALHQENLIQFDFDSGFWQCDIAQVITLAVTDDVVAFMGFQLRKLPPSTQQALQLAACIGNQFDLATLAIVSEKSEVDTAADLWKALQEGLILPISDVYKFYLSQETLAHPSENQETVTYKFLHDRVQQAAYSLIPEEQKNATHLKIGQLLQQNSSELELEEKLFDIVNHLNMGQSLITPVVERNALAQLNLAAGRKAKLATAYSAAIAYFTTGMELLPPDAWQSHYELTLALHESTAEVAYLIGQFEQMEAIANLTLQHAKTLLDKITTYETQIQASVSQNRSVESVQIALHVLKQLGIQLPKTPTLPQTLLGLAKTKLILGRKNPSDLLNLPTMSHPEKLAAMRILTSATNAAFFSSPALFPLLIFQQVNLSVQYGNTPLSAYAYACYGTLLCGALIDIDGGYKFGQLALQVLEKFNARYLQAKVLFITNITILYWKQHLRSTLLGLQKSYQVGLETGDLEYAANSAAVRGENLYWSGQELSDLAQTLRYYTEVMSQLKQDNVLIFINIYHQVVLNLTGESPNPSSLDGSVYSEAQNRSQEAIDNQTGVFYYYLNQTCLSYLFGEFAQAVKQADIVKQYLVRGTSLANNIPFHLYDSLARLALYPTATKVEQKQILRRVTQNQKKLQKWAGFAPMNLVHKLHLIEAERYRVLGQLAQAQEMYDRAIAGAKENQYLNEEALANELAAKFYLAWGKEKIAQVYMHDAYYCYARWGAKAKVDHLEKCYPQLLSSVLDRENTELSRRSMKTSIQPTETIAYTSRGNPSLLDLSTIMKASQAIAGEIELEKLLSTLMQVVLVNAGAQKGTLILSKNGDFLIAAQASRQTDAEELNWNSLQLIPLESSSETPHSLIYYAARTQETLVFDDVTVDPQFAPDNYIKTQQPKSVLCLPIINQGKLIGLLYLENNLMKGAFTGDRLEVLKLLATQSAISLENAQLYHSLEESNQTLEQKVTQRTQELHDKNQSLRETIQALKQAQLRLIQTEKMSSLGQMVAGIAHEINNPISFISGNLGHADSYTQDLIDLVETCQQELPSLNNKVQSKFQEIDIDFIKQDLKKIFGSMQNGSDRIRNLILSLRNFARLDESEVKLVNIHEGIDNTLVLLQHRLNARSDDPAIKVIKDYGNLPLISCYASQLNQVFMNVLINAIDSLESHYVIDALEESLVTSNKSEQSKNKPLQIHIYTELINNQWISIRIVDNGVGMTEKVQQQIFNPFFTTKPVGSGTGLGLSISYQIIVDMHKGNLICNSTLGKGTEFTIQIPLKAM